MMKSVGEIATQETRNVNGESYQISERSSFFLVPLMASSANTSLTQNARRTQAALAVSKTATSPVARTFYVLKRCARVARTKP